MSDMPIDQVNKQTEEVQQKVDDAKKQTEDAKKKAEEVQQKVDDAKKKAEEVKKKFNFDEIETKMNDIKSCCIIN
jgi:methyl-accepting chemotaxis protein